MNNIHIFDNLEKTKIYAFTNDTIEEWDLETKSRKSIWSVSNLRGLSIAGNRLFILFSDDTLEIVDLTQQKSLLKLAAYKSGEEIVIREV